MLFGLPPSSWQPTLHLRDVGLLFVHPQGARRHTLQHSRSGRLQHQTVLHASLGRPRAAAGAAALGRRHSRWPAPERYLTIQRQPQLCAWRQQRGGARCVASGSVDTPAVPGPAEAKEAVKEAGKNLQQTGRSAKEALQDAGQQVQRQTRGADDIPDFDLPTAVAMGVCAFEAYNDPGSMAGVAEQSESGTHTVYMDRSFLLDRVKGVLQVHIRWGAGLPPPAPEEGGKDESRKQRKRREKKQKLGISPYCTVSAGPAACVSRPVDGSQDAQWRESYFLYIRDPDTPLIVRAYDSHDEPENPVEREPIASAQTDLKPLADGALHDVRLDLGPAGAVDLSVQYAEMDGELLDDLANRAVSQMIADDWSDADTGNEGEDGSEGWFPTARGLWQTSSKLFSEPQTRMSREHANQLADNQPRDRPEFKEWTELLDGIVSRELTSRAEPLAFVANPGTDTELWVYRNKEQRDLIFAFRGTSSPKDMMTDMSVELQPFSPGQEPEQPSPPDVEEDLEGDSNLAPVLENLRGMEDWVTRLTGGRIGKLGLAKWFTSQAQILYASEHDEVWVHKGFLTAYQSVAPRLLAIAEEVMQGMGGALATLFCYELAQHKFEKVPRPEIFMYGFGSPRVGNIPFAEKFDDMVFNAWRISNMNDIVTKVPSLLGFKHVGVEVRLVEDGRIAVKRGTFDEVREGAAFGELLEKIRDGAFGEDETLQREFKEIVKAEIETAKSLFRGKAIKEHMEDSYCEMVAAAVEAGGDKCKAVMVAREAVEEAAQEDGDSDGDDEKGGSGMRRVKKDDEEEAGTAEAEADGSSSGNGAGGRTGRRGSVVAGGVGRGGEDRRRQDEEDDEDDDSEDDDDDDDDESVESCESFDSSEGGSEASSEAGDDGGDGGDDGDCGD